MLALAAAGHLRNLSGCRRYEGLVIASQFESEIWLSDEDCLDDRLFKFLLETSTVHDAGAVGILQIRPERDVFRTLRAFSSSISATLSA
jgi:hypothetical protein